MPDEPSGLGTAGKICQEVQGQGNPIKFAQDMLDMKRGNQTPDEDMEEDDVLIEGIYEEETILFAELEDDIRYQLEELLADNINEFMIYTRITFPKARNRKISTNGS